MSSFALPSDPINVGIGLFLLLMKDANKKDEAICLLPSNQGVHKPVPQLHMLSPRWMGQGLLPLGLLTSLLVSSWS